MKKKILIVEDSEVVQEMLRNGLAEAGYEVRSVYNGFEALRDLEDIQPDLIVTDIMMPKLDGLKLCEAIQNRMETRNIPFIFLSSQFDDKTVQQGKKIGARFFIAKPFKVDTIITCLEKVFKQGN
jgi:CheY-like chemotaxis protein